MKNRILQILEKYQLTPSRFADEIGVQRSSISHILAERNKPSLEIVQKILNCYPAINAEWLLLGNGPMLKTENQNDTNAEELSANLDFEKKEQLDLFSQQSSNTIGEKKSQDLIFDKNEILKSLNSSSNKENEKIKQQQALEDKSLAATEVEKVILIYSDKSFEICSLKR